MNQIQRQYHTLFLGDLSCFCQETDILNAFKVFGEILDVRLMRSKQDGRSLSYGFVTFKELNQAVKAMELMNGEVLIGRKLK